MLIGLDDTLGPRYLPASNGREGADKGFFYFDPTLAHIRLAISDEVEFVDVYQELVSCMDTTTEGRLFRYLGRFVADCKGRYFGMDEWEIMSPEVRRSLSSAWQFN